MQSFIKPIAVLGFTSILAACGGGTGDDSGGETPEQPTNTAPVANGGTSQTVTAGSEVSLNGSQSSDADGDSLTYSWSITSQPSGSTATLTTGQQANASFTPEVSGSYEVTLTVSDGTASDTATVTITVNAIVEQNAAPIANAGSNQAVVTGTQVTLNGDQSSDADGDNLTYGWSITSQPNDSNASLSNSEQVTTSFTPSLSGDYQVRLTVSDGTDSDSDTVTISVTDPVVVNNPPVANAGDDQTIDLGDSVTLDSSASSDADSDRLTAVWMIKGKPADSAFTLNTELSSTTFTPDAAGTYELSLSVSDGEESDSDTLFIIVNSVNAENTTPVANAGADQTVDLGIAVTLDASGSTDADNDTLTYVWSFRGIPTGSQVTLNNSNTVSSSFTPDIAGLYVLRVVVTDESGAVSGDNVRITVNEVEQEVANIDRWVINNTNTSDYITSGGSAVLENVQVAELRTENSVEYMYVEATGIPDYSVTLTQDDVDTLNSRPKARADFLAQSTTAVAGDTVEFGENIGYDSSDLNCNDTGGDGYWPPGPACPTDQEKQNYFPTEPQDAAEECETGLGAVGLMVNGTSIYNWSDGATWTNDANVDTEWQYLAPVAESYDVDICGGHATTTGDYHHHFYTTCLANLVGDSGDSHSPIYGFAADGYPVYGPYESDGELAVSGWKTRDYGASESEGGCNTEGERTCFLVDQYDISKGVETTAQGPDIGATVTSQSRNDFIADSGFFYEDYYYAQLPATGAQLDQHNGHDNDDGRGYHYHITLELVDGELTPSFPYTVGPNFKGDLPDNTFSRCSGATGGPRP